VHAFAEIAVDADDDLFTWLEQVGNRRLHSGAAGAGDRNGEPVVGFKHIAQEHLNLIHRLDKDRIEVANKWGGHRPQNTIIDRAWAGAKQYPARRRQC